MREIEQVRAYSLIARKMTNFRRSLCALREISSGSDLSERTYAYTHGSILYERLESQVQQVPIAESERRVDDASNVSNEDSTESALNASLNDSHHKEPDTKSHLNDEDAQAAVTADIEETL